MNGAHYLPKGPLKDMQLGNGAQVTKNYQLQSINSPALSLTYSYDAAGNITEIADQKQPALNTAYTYDAQSRLNSVMRQQHTTGYTFDLDGNRQSRSDGNTTTRYDYEAGQVLASITESGETKPIERDAYGNLISGWHEGETVTREFNVFNQLMRSTKNNTTTEYGYNAARQRAWKHTQNGLHVYVYDVSSEKLLAEYLNGQLEKEYIYVNGKLTALRLEKRGEIYLVQTDHLGRPQVVTNESQEVVWQAENNAFDRKVVINSINDLNIGFPGQYYDKESGLYYNWNRDYDPSTGRYVQTDPVGLDGGLNTYLVVGGNSLLIENLRLETLLTK